MFTLLAQRVITGPARVLLVRNGNFQLTMSIVIVVAKSPTTFDVSKENGDGGHVSSSLKIHSHLQSVHVHIFASAFIKISSLQLL